MLEVWDIQDEAQLASEWVPFLVKLLIPSSIVYLSGPLGAGKTTLIRYLLRAWGYEGLVKSPTYTLVETYFLKGLEVHHFDLYRLSYPLELLDMGIQDYLTERAICLFEWPEKGIPYIPKATLSIEIHPLEKERRRIVLDSTD